MKTKKPSPKSKKIKALRLKAKGAKLELWKAAKAAQRPQPRPGSLLAELAAGKLGVVRDKTSDLDEVAGGPTPL